MSRRVVVVGDMHVGSTVGLWDTYTDPQGHVIEGTDANKTLLEYWEHFWEWAKDMGFDSAYLLVDLCDGYNRHENGKNLTVVELEAQVEVAAKLLEPHVKGKKIYSVSGSNYHQSMDTNLDRLVTQRLDGEWHGILSHLELEGTDQIFQLAHGSGSGTMYRESGMAREMMFLSMTVKNKIPHDVNFLVRGHLHSYHYVDSDQRGYLYAPGWKLFFPWAPLLKSYGKNIPTIGGLILDVDDRGIRILKPRYHDEYFYPYFPYYDALRSG